MGTRIACHCSACGFRSEATIGGSRETYRTHSKWPILCRSCGFESTNTSREPLVCSSCHSPDIFVYGAEKPAGSGYEWISAHPRSVAQNFDRYIFDQDYPCPDCGAQAFRFGPTTMWFD